MSTLYRQFIFVPAVTALIIIGALVNESTAETWAERLGFPPSSKVIVLHAQEMGLCYETNAAIVKLLDAGLISSTAAMAPCPWFADAAKWSAANPRADVGLELTINSEWKEYRWRPVAGDALVTTLLDPDRYFWPSNLQTMVNASAEDVEHELLAQIAHAKSQGLRPTHLTTHLGALISRPDLIEVYLRVARQQWIPAMVVELTPGHVERFHAAGFPVPDDIIALLSNYPLPKVDDLRMILPAESYEAKKQAFLTMLRELPPGITQIAVHPAVESDAIKRIMPDWQQRVWETQLLGDEAVRAALRGEGLVLTNWGEIMQRFHGRPPAKDSATASNGTR